MASNAKTLQGEDEYLAFERLSEFRSEYLAGEVFAMTGATRNHNLIVTNIVAALHTQLGAPLQRLRARHARERAPRATLRLPGRGGNVRRRKVR